MGAYDPIVVKLPQHSRMYIAFNRKADFPYSYWGRRGISRSVGIVVGIAGLNIGTGVHVGRTLVAVGLGVGVTVGAAITRTTLGVAVGSEACAPLTLTLASTVASMARSWPSLASTVASMSVLEQATISPTTTATNVIKMSFMAFLNNPTPLYMDQMMLALLELSSKNPQLNNWISWWGACLPSK